MLNYRGTIGSILENPKIACQNGEIILYYFLHATSGYSIMHQFDALILNKVNIDIYISIKLTAERHYK